MTFSDRLVMSRTGWVVVATFLSTISKVAVRAGTFLVVAPVLGPAGQAVIALTSAWSSALVLIVIFGLPIRALREVGRNPAGVATHVLSDTRLMHALSIVYILSILAVGPLVVNGDEWYIWLVMATATLLNAYGDYFVSCLRALDKFERDLALSLTTGFFHFASLAIVRS